MQVIVLMNIALILALIWFVDIKNYPSLLLTKDRWTFVFVIVIGLILLSIFLLEKNVLDWTKVPSINGYDCCLQVMGWSSLLYIIIMFPFSIFHYYKLIVLVAVILASIVLACIKSIIYSEAKEYAENYESNLIDLKELFDNKVGSKKGVILLDERDVDYDLLNRNPTIDHLVKVIQATKPQGKFVISLEGRWGSGKTTILKNAKRIINDTDSNIVIIDDFDPWTYGTEESILENFFDRILACDKLKINTSDLKRSIRILTKAIIKSPEQSDLFSLFLWRNKSAYTSKKQINDYLKLSKKRVVIFIDNLDRVEDDKIKFLFKMIGNILDFDRITYVISFDPEKIKNAYDDKTKECDYVKKIIQMKIVVPEIDDIAKETLIRQCVSNLIAIYDKSDAEAKGYQEFVDYIVKNTKDIRDFKRLINSVFIKVFLDESNLCKRDKVIIEYIRVHANPVYKMIIGNKKFFISENILHNSDLWKESFSVEKFNQEGKIFFDSKSDFFSEYMDLLGIIFPYVKRYKGGQTLKSPNFVIDKDEYRKIAKTNGIASAKYFNLYFSETENEFSIIGGVVDKFIVSINSEKSDISFEFEKLLKDQPVTVHKELFEKIQLYISDINKSAVYNFLLSLFSNIWEIDNSSVFVELNAFDRCNNIMWELLQRLSVSEFEELFERVRNQYDKLETVSSISYWFENDNENKNAEGRREKWKELENNMVSDIIEQDIDLYSDEYYHVHNIWALYRGLKDQNDVFRKYVKKHTNRKTIFRMLYDLTGHSFGAAHSYYLTAESIKQFFDEEDIESYMKDVMPETEDEKFVFQIYNTYYLYPENEMGKIADGYSEEEKFLKL